MKAREEYKDDVGLERDKFLEWMGESYEVVGSEEGKVLLDLDNARLDTRMFRDMVESGVVEKEIKHWRSKSRVNRHVVVESKEREVLVRLLLAVLLGSDKWAVYSALKRVLSGMDEKLAWVLFKPREK